MDPISLTFAIIVLIFSVVAHELSHGVAADALGDPTARLQGRLTLNPIKHLDLFGSLILPAISFTLGGFIFGWAKPVPYNPYNLRNGRVGEAIVAGAGIFTNILIALIFALVIRFFGDTLPPSFLSLAGIVVITNLVLAIFNLVPIPPLDGSKLLFSFLPFSLRGVEEFLERWGLALLIFFILFFWQFLSPVISWLFIFFTGTPA